MYAEGWKNIVNVDISENVVNSMIEKYSEYSDMKWEVGDVTDL